jgi:hypothetical protein
MNRTTARALAREINDLLRQQEEVVLETADIEEFLSEGRRVDSVRTMQIVREIADANDWSAFVYDYGALVRFSRKPAMGANGFRRHASRDRQHTPLGA